WSGGVLFLADRFLCGLGALAFAAVFLQYVARVPLGGGGVPAGIFPPPPPRGAAAVDISNQLFRADCALGRPPPRLSAVQGPRSRSHSRTRPAPQRPGSADQYEGRS